VAISVAIIEDDGGIREHLIQLLKQTDGFWIRGEFATAEAALKGIPKEPPDVVLMDINLPGLSGVECVRQLKQILPKVAVMMFTVYEDSDKVFAALEAGACGYLLKRTPPDKVLEAIREVYAGGAPMSSFIARKVVQSFHRAKSQRKAAKLSPREEEILCLVSKGLQNKEIAAKLSISKETVHVHLRNVYEKLQVNSRTEAVMKYMERPGGS
jgi:DNA-binding NarL/FixJ family response regulator